MYAVYWWSLPDMQTATLGVLAAASAEVKKDSAMCSAKPIMASSMIEDASFMFQRMIE